MISRLRRYDLSSTNLAILIFLWLFFIAFMLYPLAYVFSGAFFTDKGFSLIFFKLMLTSPNYAVILGDLIYDLAQPSFGLSLSPLRFSRQGAIERARLDSHGTAALRRSHRNASIACSLRLDQFVVA